MKLLLDTHVFIWMNNSPNKLSARFCQYCEQGEDEFFLSMVTPWEIQIKQQLGKLKVAPVISKLIEKNRQENNIKLLPIELVHIETLSEIPLYHKDPFDRLLIAQARFEKMTLITADEKIRKYDIKVIW